MYNDKKILALIPARGESKGIPRKNIRPLCGKPLIAWTIEQAKMSRCIDDVVVSTDNKYIAEVSEKWGAVVPFLRPKELATDKAAGMDVVLHALEWFEKADNPYDVVVLLQPTSPLRTFKDIDNAIKLLFAKRGKAVISVSRVNKHPYWMNTLPGNRSMEKFLRKGITNTNRQDLPEYFSLNGAIFAGEWVFLKRRKTFFGKGTFAYIMPTERSIDIDGEIDFLFAENLIKNLF